MGVKTNENGLVSAAVVAEKVGLTQMGVCQITDRVFYKILHQTFPDKFPPWQGKTSRKIVSDIREDMYRGLVPILWEILHEPA